MKLSKETLTLLKNFTAINGNLLIKPGNQIATISPSKACYAVAPVAETFDTEFGIYDLNDFLSALALFDSVGGSPEIEFTEKYVSLVGTNNESRFYAADPSVLTFPASAPKFPEVCATFKLTEAQMALILKAAGAFRAVDITIIGDGKTLAIVVGDRKNPTSNNHRIVVGDTTSVFKSCTKLENFKVLPGDYTVEIGQNRAVRFTGTAVTYTIALEKDSTFN